MKLNELAERIDKLHALLHGPHPGYVEWCLFLERGMEELIEAWQGKATTTAQKEATGGR